METSIDTRLTYTETPAIHIKRPGIDRRILAFADSQAPYKTAWFLFSLIAQGVLILPIPAVLMFYYQAPVAILGVTMVLFFSNIIAGMGGLGIRVIMLLFAASFVTHLLMICFYIL